SRTNSMIWDDIDWSRMAQPQTDGYDTAVTLARASNSGSVLRPTPYVRKSVLGFPTCCDNRIAIRPAPQNGLLRDNVIPADIHHPHIEQATKRLAQWPEAYSQFAALLDT